MNLIHDQQVWFFYHASNGQVGNLFGSREKSQQGWGILRRYPIFSSLKLTDKGIGRNLTTNQ
jgi:hypothetical protein